MKTRSLSILIFIFLSFTFCSCKNTHSKVLDFVKRYNSSDAKSTNQLIHHSYAQSIGNSITDTVKIVYLLDLKKVSLGVESLKQMLPSLFTGILEVDKSLQELLNEGVKFQLVFCDLKKNILLQENVDKESVKNLLKKIQKTANKNRVSKNNLPQELNNILAAINSNFPLENKEEGTTILKIDVNEKNEMIYQYQANQELEELLKTDSAREQIKAEILQNPNFKNVITKFTKFGVKTFKYVYLDTKNEFLTEIVLNQNEFR